MGQKHIRAISVVLSLAVLSGCSAEVAYRDIHGVLFPVNESGQTYGSASQVSVPPDYDGPIDDLREYYPDLVLTVSSEGVEGYIYLDDFFPLSISSPENAESKMSEDTPIIVYELDGKTRVGTIG